MHLNIEKLSIETQTLHAELMERLSVREAQRSIGDLEGTFTVKVINGLEYVYFLHYVPGGSRRNICVGRKSPGIEALMRRHSEGRAEEAGDPIGIRELCAQLRAGKVAVAEPSAARVIKELAEGGVFRVGGVLVGTLAFACIGNILGVKWDRTTLGTRDVDIAAERKLSIVIPEVSADVPKALESLKMGFFPIPPLNPCHPSTSFAIRKNPLRVDLLTPMIGKGDEPVYISRLKAAAQPLRFLDYLIEKPVHGAVLNGDASLVLVPQPIRFALHKLVISRERPATAEAKRHKDLYQAFQLLSYLSQERPFDIEDAWNELVARGPGWKKRVEEGMKDMERRFGSLKVDG